MSQPLSSRYTAEERGSLARATASAVFQCLMNCSLHPEREGYWRAHADHLERNFTNDFGQHYSYFTAPLATTPEEISARIYAHDGFTAENFLQDFAHVSPRREGRRWIKAAPTSPGHYLFRSMENDYQPEVITVTRERRAGGVFLIVECPHLGKVALPHYHDGLTNPSWKKLENEA